jgi:hypothetical protein
MKRLIGFLFGILICMSAYTQELNPEVVSSAGDFYTHSSASISFTIGEAIVETYSSSNYILNQGFQQASYTISAIKEVNNSSFIIKLYPNPVHQGFYIDTKIENWTVNIYSVTGQQLYTEKIQSGLHYIDMSDYALGNYFIKIIDLDKNILGTYKIQKMN